MREELVYVSGSKILFAQRLLEQDLHIEEVVAKVSAKLGISESYARLTVSMAQN